MSEDNLLKTFTETEEKKYQRITKRYVSLRTIFVMTLLLACAGIINLYSYHTCGSDCKVHNPEKMGAGDTWICPNCGNESYDWQVSCLKCGRWR